MTDLEQEREARLNQWRDLAPDSDRLRPALLNDLRIYRGGRGIYVDLARTRAIARPGITVSVLHTGRHYPDELGADGIIYHYPVTESVGRDAAEVAATKAAITLGIPIFVIGPSVHGSALRTLYLGWGEAWDDEAGIFSITFGDRPPDVIDTPASEEPFQLEQQIDSPRRAIPTRPGQHRFHIAVIQRYGTKCAVCSIEEPALLDAAHIRPRRSKGSDDPRNGLVLCALHHRALDAGFFGIDPVDLRVVALRVDLSLDALGITESVLCHQRSEPHIEALEWLWGNR